MKRLSLLLIVGMLSLTACKHKKPATNKRAPQKKGLPSVAMKTMKLKKHDGLFTIYEDTTSGKAYLQLTKEQLDKQYIYFSYTENGVVQAGHFRGSYRDNVVFRIRKRYNYIEFVKENNQFYFDSTQAISKAKDANISPSVLVSESLIAKTKDSLYLISADKIFRSETLSRVKPPSLPIPGAMFSFKLGRLNPQKTHYTKIRNYPENTDILVEYVYDNPSAFISGGSEVTDPRSVSIQVQHSLIEVPENDFEVRFDDARVGYFMTQQTDMTSMDPAPYRDMIHKWNLKKKNPDAALSEPVKPITWWIENTTPRKYRSVIKKAGETWNLAFEKAGFKNAVVVKEQPDTAEWDAGDIRYNVLRWTSSPRPPFGGYGPSFVNPLTGEILGADIMLEYVFLTGRMNSYDILTAESLDIPDWDEELKEHQNPDHMHACKIGDAMHHNLRLGMANLLANNAGEAEKEKFVESAVYYLILHEMGHTMGLMHNMKASNLWMPEDIHNTEKTQKQGLIGSVMDYPAININPDHEKQGDYYTQKPGPYDMWAIEFAYTPGLEDANAEKKRIEKILSRSAEHELLFGNDADDMRSPGKGMDPRVMIFDISGDAVNYSADRIGMLKNTMTVLKDRFTEDGKNYHAFRNSYYTLQKEIYNAGQVISRYVGGVYIERAVKGQPGAKQPYTPVPEDYQKQAMKHLADQLYAPNAFDAPENFYNYLQAQRRGFGFFGTGEDPKIHDMALRIQAASIVHILHHRTLKRVTNSSLYGNTYSVMDIMEDLEKAIFDADLKGSSNTFRINLQNYYVNKLIQVSGLKSKSSSYDNISQTAAFGSLQSIRSKMNSNKNRGNSMTQAHRAYLVHLIDKAMEK